MKVAAPPPTHRAFRHPWAELSYTHDKAAYWLYSMNDRRRARYFAVRMKHLLEALPKSRTSIIRASAQAVLADIDGDVRAAIEARKREVALIVALHVATESLDPRVRAFARSGYDKNVLRRSKRVLAARQGQLRRRAL